MRNFVFISPNFPENYWKFCKQLQDDGFNVLGIGDCPYEQLKDEVKNSVDEYYWVTNLEHYEEVYRAVAFYIFKYGQIEFLESNNEYWLERDAALRTAFNIKSGFLSKDVKKIKYKSQMKKCFVKADLKVARHCIVKSLNVCKKFIAEVGYPVIVKPDNGVGANDTRKLENDEQLAEFLEHKSPVQYIMEEYVDGEVLTYDAVIDGNGEPVFETGNVTPSSLMDVVNENGNCAFYILDEPYADVREAGRKTVKAFNVKNRFVHFEYFRLSRDQSVGKKGELVALEVNMRPSGGISPDMMNYANSVDVYKIWADVLAFGSTQIKTGERYYCAFAGRRDGKNFVMPESEILEKYAAEMRMTGRVPRALSGAMADTMYVAAFKTKKHLQEFYSDVMKTH